MKTSASPAECLDSVETGDYNQFRKGVLVKRAERRVFSLDLT